MSKRVVLIDRDPIRRAKWSRAFSDNGFEVSEFEAGKDAVKHLLFSSVNAVVLHYSSSYDPAVPISAGKRIVQEITDVDAFVPLIVVCERCDALEHGTSAAADVVLRDPVAPRQLVEGVKGILAETLRQRAQRKSGYIFAFR